LYYLIILFLISTEIRFQPPDNKKIQSQEQQYAQGCPSIPYPAMRNSQQEHNTQQGYDKCHHYGTKVSLASLTLLLVLTATKHRNLASATIQIRLFCHVDFTFTTQRYSFLGIIVITIRKY
jgi:hypothetical protein